MKRYIYSQHVDAPTRVRVLGFGDPSPKVETDSQPKDEVFRLIYANDPLTGRPRSDLGTYLGENTSPLVRDFIERMLRNDFTATLSPIPDEVTDEDITYLTRDRYETVEDYSKRVSQYLNRQKQSFGEQMARQRVKKLQQEKELALLKEFETKIE